MSQDLPVHGNPANHKSVSSAVGAEADPEIPSTMQSVQPSIVPRREASSLYIAGFVVLQLVLICSTFILPATQWFMWHDNYPGLRNIGYAQRAGGRDCQVLIYGDSSSLTGLNPSIIQQMTGLTSCNISEGATEQIFVGSDVPLQAYLQHHPAPRFLLSTWCPVLLSPDMPAYSHYAPDGVVYALQFGDRKKAIEHLLWPPQAVKFIPWVLEGLANGLFAEVTGESRKQVDERAHRDALLGQWPYALPPQTHCVQEFVPFVLRRQESVDAFRRKYSSPQTTVIVDVSPVPDCDKSFAVYAAANAGLHDNTFERLPIRFFNEGDRHFSAEGSRYISEEAARQILALEQQQRTADQPAGVPASR